QGGAEVEELGEFTQKESDLILTWMKAAASPTTSQNREKSCPGLHFPGTSPLIFTFGSANTAIERRATPGASTRATRRFVSTSTSSPSFFVTPACSSSLSLTATLIQSAVAAALCRRNPEDGHHPMGGSVRTRVSGLPTPAQNERDPSPGNQLADRLP